MTPHRVIRCETCDLLLDENFFGTAHITEDGVWLCERCWQAFGYGTDNSPPSEDSN